MWVLVWKPFYENATFSCVVGKKFDQCLVSLQRLHAYVLTYKRIYAYGTITHVEIHGHHALLTQQPRYPCMLFQRFDHNMLTTSFSKTAKVSLTNSQHNVSL
jgi:hypothetical protein